MQKISNKKNLLPYKIFAIVLLFSLVIANLVIYFKGVGDYLNLENATLSMQDIILYSPYSASIKKIYFKEKEKVESGTILLELDNKDFTRALTEAEYNLNIIHDEQISIDENMRIILKELEKSQNIDNNNDIDEANRIKIYEERLAKALFDENTARKNYEYLANQHAYFLLESRKPNALQTVREEEAVARKAKEEALIKVEEISLLRASYQKSLQSIKDLQKKQRSVSIKNIQSPIEISDQTSERKNLLSQKLAEQEKLSEENKKKLEFWENRKEQALINLKSTQILSPRAGFVQEYFFSIGSQVEKNTPLVRISSNNTDYYGVVVSVPLNVVNRINKSQIAYFHGERISMELSIDEIIMHKDSAELRLKALEIPKYIQVDKGSVEISVQNNENSRLKQFLIQLNNLTF